MKARFIVLGNPSITEYVLSTTRWLVEQTLRARPLRAVGLDIKQLSAITPNQLLHGTKIDVYHIYYTQKTLAVIESSKTLPTATSLLQTHLGQIQKRLSTNLEQWA